MKVGIVNDSPLAIETLRRALALRPEHEVIWIARDGEQAVQLCKAQRPDLVLMDVVMPKLDGGEVTRRIMKQSPCAILIVTSDVGAQARKVYEALGCGAVDAVDTSGLMRDDFAQGAAPLLSKIEMVKRLIAERQSQGNGSASAPVTASEALVRLVAIGASAGGPAALATVLRQLPASFPAAVVVIQHIDATFRARNGRVARPAVRDASPYSQRGRSSGRRNSSGRGDRSASEAKGRQTLGLHFGPGREFLPPVN